ncbi:MAG: hypothetical protein HN501_05995, partial [Waddliaceae bacterium]|nr:hypothetical protein [Waddliaceae bacterium]
MKKKRRTLKKPSILSIPAKANRALNVVLIIMVVIVFRVWHLAVIQHDTRVESARKPQRRTIIERAERGTIRDRFNIPLAINKMQYNAAIFYSQIREIPRITRKRDTEGTTVKCYARKEHITSLAVILAEELDLDEHRVEDLIHSKAALLPNVPFVIKEDITEEQYFRLKMLEKSWAGLHAERVPKRWYPGGRSASDVIGYMGAISREEYNDVVAEIKDLEGYIADEDNGLESILPKNLSSSEEVRHRLKTLEERAYTINDYVGKSGVESVYDENLRGFRGKKTFYSDARGTFLRELPGSRDPIPGQRLVLTISSELQEYAEELLAHNEKIREGKSIYYDVFEGTHKNLDQPWIKGGAIIAMDPNNGEILALASFPRYDPNDFIPTGDIIDAKKKRSNVYRWLESERHISEVWNRKSPLEREAFNVTKGVIEEERLDLSWGSYIAQILPEKNKARKAIENKGSLNNAIALQRAFKALMALADHDNAIDVMNALYSGGGYVAYCDTMPSSDKEAIISRFNANGGALREIRNTLDPIFRDLRHNYDKLLVLDLFSLASSEEFFSHDLLDVVGGQSIEEYRDISTKMLVIEDVVHAMTKDLFHSLDFIPWLAENKKAFLKGKRREEKAAKRYNRPYLDLLDKQERSMFVDFWQKHRWDLIAAFVVGDSDIDIPDDIVAYANNFLSWEEELRGGAHRAAVWHDAYATIKERLSSLTTPLALEYLKGIRSYEDLSRPLYGKYPHLRHVKGVQLEKHLAAAFYPIYGFGYGRSRAFREAAPQGSIFKIITAYAALNHRYKQLGPGCSKGALNPLVIIDNPHLQEGSSNKWNVGYTASWKPIDQRYKGGRLLRSARRNIGKIDIYSALETSSNLYFSLLAGDVLEDPEDLNRAAMMLSYGSRTGLDLPGEISGSLPNDLSTNKTGLYAHAIGQHSLVATPLQTAVMLSAIANGGNVVKPKVLKLLAGKEPLCCNVSAFDDDNPYRESLDLAGANSPLFSGGNDSEQKSLIHYFDKEVVRETPLPKHVRDILLDATNRVLTSPQGCASTNRIRNYYDDRDAIKALNSLKKNMCGKTSSAEKVESVTLDIETGTHVYKHLWFGGTSFDAKTSHEGEGATVFFDEYGKPEI